MCVFSKFDGQKPAMFLVYTLANQKWEKAKQVAPQHTLTKFLL